MGPAKRAKSFSDLEAVGFALTGFTFWVFADTSMKMAGRSMLPAYEMIAFLGLWIVAILIAYGMWLGDVRTLWPRRLKRQLVRSCLDLVNNICVVIALRHLSLTLFYILVFMSPLVITILAAIFLRELLEWRKVMAIVVGFAGVVIAVDPFGSIRQGDWIGLMACIACVACFSVNMVWSRVITQTERPESLTFFSGLVMAVFGSALMLWHTEPVTPRLAAVLGAMGLFCAMGSLCFLIALKHTTAANVSQYHYTQLISGSLLAYLIWRDVPTPSMVIGGLLIVGSGFYIAWLASRRRVSTRSVTSQLAEEQRDAPI